MFYMMNDDMDDMMRKAADDYELNDEMASDWNKVLAGIQQPEQPFIAKPKEKKRRKYILFLWFILIPVMLFTAYKLNLFTLLSSNNKTIVRAKSKSYAKTKKADNNVKQINNNIAVTNSLTPNQKKLNEKIDHNADQKSVSLQTGLPSSNINKNKQAINNLSNVVYAETGNYKHALSDSTPNRFSEISRLLTGSSKTGILNTTVVADTTTIKQQLTNDKATSTQKNLNRDSLVAKSSKQKTKSNNYTKQAFTYAGIITNADISFIKNQKTSSPSLGVGIIGGYHFKNGISIESGLLYDRKNYYTKGKYFNTDMLSYLQNVQLLATNGNCYMYEIPLNVAYDFKSHKKINWFVTAGTSSYLMHKEYYNFKYDYNGSYGEKGYDYYHSSKNWFSVLNLGAGVNIQTSNKYFIKLQPYFKVPLSGIGIGKLPLSSAGINFSLTRRIR